MNYLFSGGGLQVLRTFCRAGTLVALDYDGTLAPINLDPAQAFMGNPTRNLLDQLSRHYPTLVLTGRSRADAMRLLDLPAVEVIGNHGMEAESPCSDGDRAKVADWKSHLQTRLTPATGIVIEDKGLSLSVHYRNSASHAIAGELVRRAAMGLPDARLVGGKCVLNIVPKEAPDKGSALFQHLRRVGASRALFVGDDITDEAVFSVNRPDLVLSVRVGYDASSHARYYVHDRNQVDMVLQALMTMRAE
ncbi:trehalose-phosphatase [Lysobacter niabensis]|uniref:trehalose-phosphatase n=1 Tax=Agrilutibacter niabensis TaxID=380628 RepID=UPI00360C7385